MAFWLVSLSKTLRAAAFVGFAFVAVSVVPDIDEATVGPVASKARAPSEGSPSDIVAPEPRTFARKGGWEVAA